MPARARRIVLYAVNGSGLGHVTRLLAVARWMRRYATFLDGALPEIFFLTSTEATGLLAEAGFPAFKLPSKSVARRSGLDLLEYRRLARHFVWSTLNVFVPDLLVVDTFPAGSFDELFQLLDGPFCKAFIHRRVKPEYARRPIFHAALGLYDVIAAPHGTLDPPADAAPPPAEPGPPQEQAPVGAAAPSSRFLPPRAPQPVPCGEVLQLEQEEAWSREQVFQELGLQPSTRLVYLSAGGGGDPGCERVLTSLVEALRGQPGLHLLVGAGPLYQGRRPGGAQVTWSSDAGIARWFAACDAAISAGGYNTFHELIYFGVPSLFFAQDKVADDQQQRIAAAVARGACGWLADPADAAAVRRELAALLQPERRAALREACARLLPENGASRCARVLLEPLYGAASLARAADLLTPRLVHALEQQRTPQAAAALLGGALPRLMPPAGVADGPDGGLAGPALEQLVAALSPAAAAEVQEVLRRQPEQAERKLLEEALLALLRQAAQAGLGGDRLAGLVETAIRKHPLAQEAGRRWMPWATGLVNGLTGLLALAVPGLAQEELLELYRVFPRLADCDAAESFGLFGELVTREAARGGDLRLLLRQLQALKLLHRQVGRAQLLPLLAAAGGGGE